MNRLNDARPPNLQARIDKLRPALAGLFLSDDADADDRLARAFRRGEQDLKVLTSWLLDTEQQEMLGLNPLNAFLLHAGAYLAAIGRVDGGGSILLENSSTEESQISSLAEGSMATILAANWAELGFSRPEEAEVAAGIGRAVGDSPLRADGGVDAQDAAVSDETLNPGLLAAGLRLARALDLADGCARRELLRLLPEGTPLTRETLAQHYEVLATGPHRHFPGTIRVKLRCRHPEVHRALKRYETRVQRLLADLNRQVTPRFLFSDCRFEIDARGYDPLDLKFTVDSSAALQLFTGNRLYADRRAFLRELLQNAIDACRLRTLVEPDYTPGITIRFQDDIRIVSVADNGIGMDRQWIEKYFLQIGISFYQSGRIRRIDRDRGVGLSFISQFGIGFLSSFLVAEKIIIRTRKAGSPGMVITIHDLKEYFDVRPPAHEVPVGTEVTLHLKPSRAQYCRSLEYIGYLKTNIRFLKVPVRLVDENNRTTSIGMEKLPYAGDGGRGTAFVAPLDLPASEGYLLLQAKKQTRYIQGIEPAHGGVSIFQDGIFVTQIETLLPEGARQHVIGRLNLEGADKCELSMDRNRIFWSEERLRALRQAIRRALGEVANRLVAAVEAQEAPEATRESIINQLAIFFDFNEVDDGLHSRLCPPIRVKVEKRFRDFVRINFAHAVKSAGRPAADGYNEGWQQAILDGFLKRRRG
jgi:hypothetical protein